MKFPNSSKLPDSRSAHWPATDMRDGGAHSSRPTVPFTEAFSGWAIVAAAGLIVLVTAAAFSSSFAGVFVFDDEFAITNNPTIRQLWPIWTTLCPPRHGETVTGRPLLNLSLAINYAISGYGVWSYHAVNLAIHILGALLLFGILRRTFLLPTMRDRWGAAALPLAFVVALLWAIHPLQTESVTYIVQRAESLVGMFYLLTLYCFIRGTSVAGSGVRGQGLRKFSVFSFQFRRIHPSSFILPPVAWYAGSVLACLLGMASKEVMISAPLVVLLYDRTFARLVSRGLAAALRFVPGLGKHVAAAGVAGAFDEHGGHGGGAGIAGLRLVVIPRDAAGRDHPLSAAGVLAVGVVF